MAASPVFEFANNIKIGTIVKNVITVRQSLYSKVLSSLNYVTAMLTAMDLCISRWSSDLPKVAKVHKGG